MCLVEGSMANSNRAVVVLVDGLLTDRPPADPVQIPYLMEELAVVDGCNRVGSRYLDRRLWVIVHHGKASTDSVWMRIMRSVDVHCGKLEVP